MSEKTVNSISYDRRTCERYVEKGLLKENELKAYLKSLPDDSANAQWVQMDVHDAETLDPDDGDTEGA